MKPKAKHAITIRELIQALSEIEEQYAEIESIGTYSGSSKNVFSVITRENKYAIAKDGTVKKIEL